MSDDYWETKMRHPSVRGMFRTMERQMSDVDFDLHVSEALHLANSSTHSARCGNCNYRFGYATAYECPVCDSATIIWERNA